MAHPVLFSPPSNRAQNLTTSQYLPCPAPLSNSHLILDSALPSIACCQHNCRAIFLNHRWDNFFTKNTALVCHPGWKPKSSEQPTKPYVLPICPPLSPSPSTTPIISLASVSLSGPLSALVKLVPGWSQMLKPCPLCWAFAGLHSPLTPNIATPPSPSSLCSNLSSPTWVNQQPHIIPKSPPILRSWHDQCFLLCSAFFFPQ